MSAAMNHFSELPGPCRQFAKPFNSAVDYPGCMLITPLERVLLPRVVKHWELL